MNRRRQRVGSEESEPRDVARSTLLFAAVVGLPWIYWSFDHYEVIEGKIRGFNITRFLWLAPLFYLVAGVGTVLSLHEGPLKNVLALGTSEVAVRSLTFHLWFPLGFVEGALPAFSAVDGIVLAATVTGTVLVGRAVNEQTTRWRIDRIRHDGGDERYVVPLSRVEDAEGESGSILTLKKNYSTLVLGASGFGKTEAIKLLVNQMQSSPDEPVVVFDYKSEYEQLFDDDEIIKLSVSGSTQKWNIFQEVEHEREFRDIGRRLFPESEAETMGENAFFQRGARQIFVATLQYMWREPRLPDPSNKDLAEFFERTGYQTLYKAFENHGHEDLAGRVESYLDPDAAKMAQSLYSFLRQTVNDVFVDDFAAEGTFSIQEYMEDPDGNVLILEMPQTSSDTVAPAFRFFLDRAIQYALADADRGSYFILDEFARVPGLDNIEDLTGAGRSQRAQAILGLQGISQLKSNYEEQFADDILASVTQEILLRPGDQQTSEYVLDRLGKEQYVVRREKPTKWWESDFLGSHQETIEEVHRIPQATVQQFDKGEAIIITENGWVWSQLPMWSKLPPWTRRALANQATDDGGIISNLRSTIGAFDRTDSTETTDEDSPEHRTHCPACESGLGADPVNYCPTCGAEIEPAD